jgi:hypothetical protein
MMLQDLRFAFRMLLRSKGYTAVAVVALALGSDAIGADEALIKYSVGFDAGVAENDCAVNGQVLVDLEFQTVCSSGSSAVPSRANSAA